MFLLSNGSLSWLKESVYCSDGFQGFLYHTSGISLFFHQHGQQHHRLNSLVVHNVDSAALNVSRHDPRSNRSFPGNNNGVSSSNNKHQQPFCDNCNKHGHTRLICWKLVGYPKDASRSDSSALAYVAVPAPTKPSITAEQYARILALLDPANGDIAPSANFAGPTNEQGDWME